ncbi:Hypothetical predicted protein [Olea europaea subsp. europaea]|uniref:Uncharacterized protein n=1 Tax=Olea europaea subsp. europaea TaxID=158383 RepID=A0A8S0TWX3_OLEEU|nr:Hypothetical predicted protein [Olea europaea subsp. europaea]
MATLSATPTTADQNSNTTTKTVDASLWWDPFSSLLADLENSYLASEFPSYLEKQLKDNHAWFLNSILLFKPPNQKSKEALFAQKIKIGSHEVNVQPELKDVALKISSVLCLDEVQSYIIVRRSIKNNDSEIDSTHKDIFDLVMLEYYVERQCLLKCTRQILIHALYLGRRSEGSGVLEEAQRLISDGLESKLLSVFQDLLSANYPEQMDVDLYTLWAEEILIEENLILEVLFLAYYESFCTCDAKCWKRLCLLYQDIITGSYNFGKLAISPEAVRSIYHAKVQLLLILIEALDLENLLQMVHDEIPFRQGSVAFSITDVQEMDSIISCFSAFETKEAGPLILTWAVFLCLISSLPEKDENNFLMIDHIGYVRQAFEVSSLSYFLEILESATLKDSDGPIAGYKSVLRTFISSFIASYEISLQFEDKNLKVILEILCKIYRGEESLCIQFWDRESFVDGPIRCLLCNLEGEFPFRTIEFVQFLSALSEGAWPAECAFNFLDKSVGLSSPFEMSSNSVVDASSKIVEARLPVHLPGVEGFVIPSRSRGHVLRMINSNTALVRWEYTESGVLVLLLRLGQEVYLKSFEESTVTLDLLSRLVTFNMAICYALMDAGSSSCGEVTSAGKPEKYPFVNVVEILCALVKSLPPNCNGAIMMSMGVTILSKMLKCLPFQLATMMMNSNIFDLALKTNPFNVSSNGLSSGSWLLSGRLAKMLLIDCEQSDCSLTLSVLDFTMRLVEIGIENDVVLALVVFSLQYVLVNHEFWKYKVKHARWKVTTKALEVVKYILSVLSHWKLGEVVRDILLCDASIHSALFRIVCTTTHGLEKLQFSRLIEMTDIEGLQLAISSGLDVLASMVSDLSKDLVSISVFHQAMLSPTTKPIPVAAAAMSLLSYFHNPKIQTSAARLLSMLFVVDFSHSSTFSNASFGLDDKQVDICKNSIYRIISEQLPWSEDLIVATLKLLIFSARYQPAFCIAVIASKENLNAQLGNTDCEQQPDKADYGLLLSKEISLLDAILQYVRRSEDLMRSKPTILLNVLDFLKALWQSAPQFTNILELLKKSDKFWRQLTNNVTLISSSKDDLSGNLTEMELQNLAYGHQCQSKVFEILAYEIFLQKKLMRAALLVKQSSKSTDGGEKSDDSQIPKDANLTSLKDIFSTWCENSLLTDLIKSCVSCEYDNSTHIRAKVAACLFAVHMMRKLKTGDFGSLSVSLVEKITILSQKLSKLPAFSELLTQYTERGYSEGKDLHNLVLNDLFYHMQGELEGRFIDNRPFKELSQYLIDSSFLDTYKHKRDCFLPEFKDVYLYDTVRLRSDLGLELWDLSAWKTSKEIAETMLHYLQDVNLMMFLSNTKVSALGGLISMLHMLDDNSTDNEASIGLKIPNQLVSSCIDHICQCLHATIGSLTLVHGVNDDALDILAAQAELLLTLIRSENERSSPDHVLVLKTSGYGLKVLTGYRSSAGVRKSMEHFLLLILCSVKATCKNSLSGSVTGNESVVDFAETSNSTLGILPVLCNCIELNDHCALSLTTIDLILKGFSAPSSWFPIVQKHLQLQHIIQKLQDKNSYGIVSIILKFLLTIAQIRHGAEMLINAGFLASVRVLLSDLPDRMPFSVIVSDGSFSNKLNNTEKPQYIWGLSLAVITAIIHSLGDNSTGVVDYVMACLLVEKAPVISYYLSAPDFPSDGNEKKRARVVKTNISLSELRETEHTIMLICVLARHRNSWTKDMKVMESQLRERSIHFLGFISRATQRHGESPEKVAPLLCHPMRKEEFEWHRMPSFIKSRNGWFALSCQTQFSDMIATEIYKVAFLLLKFLCQQAENVARRAEEVGFIDLAHFPELPMPDILHGLQDQGIVIVTELCEANKMKQLTSEIRNACLLLMQITIMALYLEFCVVQICGMRPVLGHIENFSKELRLLMRATEGHSFLKEPIQSLKQIVSFVYPDLLQTEALF